MYQFAVSEHTIPRKILAPKFSPPPFSPEICHPNVLTLGEKNRILGKKGNLVRNFRHPLFRPPTLRKKIFLGALRPKIATSQRPQDVRGMVCFGAQILAENPKYIQQKR